MLLRRRAVTVVGFVLFLSEGPFVHRTEAQPVRIEGIFPRQLPRGQETAINVAVQNGNAIQAVEVSPSAGVKVSGVTVGQNFQGAYTWSELHIAIAADAAPGQRTLVLLLPTGRTAPVTITIPEHVPIISELHVLPAQSNPPSVGVQFSVVDPSADIGESPYVWFMLSCGSEIFPGVVHGKVTKGDGRGVVVHANFPSANPKGKCEFQVRVADSGGVESNTLKTQL
jgi:hypothetical protein